MTTYFRSLYSNKDDDFEIQILGKDPNFETQMINATATLSYKDVDNILEPIRGTQLDINIDANIEKPYDLFLDFREGDFEVLFYRNKKTLFRGFINPEGVQQSYTSINWVAQLTAFDGLANLKNTKLPYTNQTPCEFVFMDLALKQTGLELPIAFFDDINQRKKENNVTTEYGLELNELPQRRINPEVYQNDNGRFENCLKVLTDILQKYNAVLFQHNIETYNNSTGQKRNQFCWVFCRVPLLSRSYQLNQSARFKIKKINSYDVNGEPDIVYNPDIRFVSPTYHLGTDGQQGIDVIHKNKNQFLSQTRGLQNFRFVHKWLENNLNRVNTDGLTNDVLSYIGDSFNEEYYIDNLPSPRFKAKKVLNLYEFADITVPLENVSGQTATPGFIKHNAIIVPNQANKIKITARGTLNYTAVQSQKIITAMQYQIVHEDLQGNRRYLKQPPSGGSNSDVYTLNQIFIESFFRSEESFWILDSEIEPDAYTTDISVNQVSHTLFTHIGEEPDDYPANFEHEFELPRTPVDGGTYHIYFSQLQPRIYPSLGQFASSTIEDVIYADLEEFTIKIITPSGLGKGEYHDANNEQDVSKKTDKPINVINADEKKNIFLNSLRRKLIPSPSSPETSANYDFWTSDFHLETDIPYLLQLTSIERIRLFSKSQNIFSGDINGYIPYFTRIINTAYPPQEVVPGNFGIISQVFTKYEYDTADNTISAEMRECKMLQPDVNYEKTIIFEDEEQNLIDGD